LPATKGIFAGTVVFGETPVTSAGIPIPGDSSTVAVVLDLTAMTGTSPSLTFEVQWSMDGGTWASAEPADAFNALTTAPVTVAKKFDVKAPYFRVSIAVTGSDSPTFTGTANAYL
jgi:hypothetical protein